MTKLDQYLQRLGIEVPSATAKAVDVEAGKAGYEKYLADVEAATTARNNAIEAEKSKQTWWDKASSIILQANGMSSTMTNDPISTGFNQAVAAYKSIPDDYNSNPTDDWTDDERWAFGEKYATNAEGAYAFAKDLNSRKAKEQKQKQQEAIAKWSGKNLGTGLLGSAASLGLNTIYGGVGYLDALAQKAAGKEIEQNILLPHEAAGAMQSGVATKLNEKGGTLNENIPIIGGKGWGDVYGLGMSIGQSTLGAATGGSAGTLIQFFGMAASQGVTDALSRGANGDQAIAYGTIAGAAEAITEMISVDKLLGITSSEGVQNVFKNILKQAGEEAREEFTTAMITNVADNWIMGGKSQFYQTVNQLVASGMSEEEAKKKAWLQTIEDIAFDTISGALSGATTGAGATIVNRANQMNDTAANDLAKQILAPEQSKLIEDAKQYDTTKKRASALEKKVADGKELSGYELRMLSSQLNEAKRTKDVDTVRKAIVEQMKTEGVSESQAKTLGEIALNKAIGNDVSKVQELMLKRNAAAMKVYNQISAEVMESGIGESEWAEKTPIQRLRTEKKASEMISDVKTQPVSGAKLEQVKGKYTEVDGKITFKKSENSRIHIDGITSSLTADDIAELSAVEKIANELGIDIHVYETTVDEKGQRTYTDKTGKKLSDSGYYDPNDNSIHIDLRAGQNGEGTMLYTASHEVVHFIKENAPEHYDALEELVTKELVKGGFSMEKAIEVQRNKATENGQTLTDEQLREEVIAEACQSFLASKTAVAEIKALKTKNKGLWTALKKFFTTLFTKLNKVYKTVDPDSIEGKYIADMRKAVKPIRDAFMEGAVEAGKKANAKTTTTEKTTAKEVKSQARSISKITAEMTDAERYEILKDRKITAPYYSGEVDNLIAERKEQLYGKTKQEAKAAIISIAKALGLSKTEINFDDVAVKVQVSNSNLSKSISQDATPKQMAKLLPIIVPVAKASIHIERHTNRYYFDNDTVYFDNLIGAYADGENVIPIRFGLKHSGMGTTTLYVFVDQSAINKTSLDEIKNSTGRQDATPDNPGVNNLHRRATYSLSQMIEFVKSKDLLRYLPDEMLDDEQRKAKWEAIAETIKKTDDKNDKRYVEYITNGDERSARQMVRVAAKANGYTDVVYHGTKAFGFTEFDTEKSDDKRSLFAAGSTELAQTYSGKHGTKKLSDNKNIDGLSNEEVVKMLNAETAESYEGAEMQTEYEIMTLKDVNNLINEVNDGIDDLQKVLEGKIKEYADKMARDFYDKDAKTHSRLIEANELLKAYEYKRLSTPLYVLLHYTDALESNPEVAELEYKIRLMNKLTDTDTSNGVVVKKDLGGYGVTVLTFDKAREELKGLVSSGNYALYGNPGRQLVIDAKGQNWNNIKNWIQSAYHSTNDTYVKKDDMYYRLYDSDTNEQIFHGRIEITDKNKDMSIDSIHPIMVQKANNVLAIRSEYMKTTRDIAKFAKDEGYNSIKFENLVDNGGAGESVEAGDVYVYFNPSDLKSADTITYDENDKIIPISQRFDATKKDIRHKSRSTVTSAPYISPTATSIVTDIDSEYKYTKADKALSAVIASQIAFTNAQAGIEHIGGKKYGIKNIESLVQAARVSKNQAEEMIAGNQYRIGADTKEYLGEGLQKIIQPLNDMSEEEQRAFFDYLLHYHNADRMSLERRSQEWHDEKQAEYDKYAARLVELVKEKNTLEKEIRKYATKTEFAEKLAQLTIRLTEIKRELAKVADLKRAANKALKATPVLKNKPVLGLNREEIAKQKNDLLEQIKTLREEKQALAKTKHTPDVIAKLRDLASQIDSLETEMKNLTDAVSEEQSREIISEYESNYPDFKEIAEKIWKYNSNLNLYRVDAGLINQEQFDYLQKLYPHYVPAYRADNKTGIAAVKGKNNVAISKTIKVATGSTKDILNPIVIMARQTMETVRAGRINQIANALYDGAKGDTTYLAAISKEKVKGQDVADLDPTTLRPKNNQVTFFKNGEKIVLQVSSEIFAGFDAFTPDAELTNPIKKLTAGAMNVFKKLVTSANPAFLIRNGARDLQDAGINTKYGTAFAKSYAHAISEIKNDGEKWKLYRAMGGSNESYFDFDKGFKKQQTAKGFAVGIKSETAGTPQKVYETARNAIQRIENANNYIETLPRFAEFIASLEAGNTAEQAMLDAADVTTNFARTGKVTKALNKYVIPFLNPSIQGASKAYRNVKDAVTAGDAKTVAKEFSKLAFKAALIGVLPMLLNGLMYRDDEEYKDLRETDKENNFLIKVGDTFWKIPRGRMASVIAGLFNRSVYAEEFDLKGYLENVSTQMSPVESMSRTIFSPFMDVKNNVTWYGSAIEGKQFENLSPSQRYDESTSSIAIAMAKFLNKFGAEASPKKIHYLLDQYSGVIGDFILPATSKKAEKDFLSGNFTIDPVTSNKLSDQFYDMYYEAQYAKNADENDKVAEYQVKHLNRVKSAVSKLFEEKSKIQNSDLSDKEKLAETRAIQILINEAYKTALEDYDLITNAIKATSKVDDKYRYTEVLHLVYGAQTALEQYDEKVYEKSTLLKKPGVSYEVFYNYYFATRDIESDKDKKGNPISGSKKTKVIKAIDKINTSEENKLLLIAISGYSFDEAKDKEKLIKYINNLKISAKDKATLAELCGFEYKNGKIYASK